MEITLSTLAKKTPKALTLGILSFLLAAEYSVAGERIVYDSRGGAHRVPNIDYKPPVKVGGILPRMIESKTPLELLSPFAGTEYGVGRGFVSWNSREGKPKGFIFFSAKVW
jgi:hypothetical protein